MVPLFACAAGIYLGLHFNILVLVPFSILGAGAFMLSPWTSGLSFIHAASLLVIPMICIQAGYMVGLTARGSYGHLRSRLNIGISRRI